MLRGYMKDWKERKRERRKAKLGEQYISDTDTDTESEYEGDWEYFKEGSKKRITKHGDEEEGDPHRRKMDNDG